MAVSEIFSDRWQLLLNPNSPFTLSISPDNTRYVQGSQITGSSSGDKSLRVQYSPYGSEPSNTPNQYFRWALRLKSGTLPTDPPQVFSRTNNPRMIFTQYVIVHSFSSMGNLRVLFGFIKKPQDPLQGDVLQNWVNGGNFPDGYFWETIRDYYGRLAIHQFFKYENGIRSPFFSNSNPNAGVNQSFLHLWSLFFDNENVRLTSFVVISYSQTPIFSISPITSWNTLIPNEQTFQEFEVAYMCYSTLNGGASYTFNLDYFWYEFRQLI